MSRRSFITMGCCAAFAVSLIFSAGLSAQGKKKGGVTRISGRVQMISKDTSTITIRRDTQQIQIKYDANTKFTYRNQPGSIDQVKEGVRVICLVTKGDAGETLAVRIDVREANK